MAHSYSIRSHKKEHPAPTFPACRAGKPHHWMLSEPEDGKVLGLCRRCHRKREYSASMSDTERFSTILKDPQLQRITSDYRLTF